MTAWASTHATLAAWLCVLVFVAACAGVVALGIRLLHRDGKHAGGDSRDEAADPFAGWDRPAEIAHEPAPPAADPLAKAALAVTADEAAEDEEAWYLKAPAEPAGPGAGANPLEGVVTLAEAQARPLTDWESNTFVGGIPVVRDEHGLVKPAFDTTLIDAGAGMAAMEQGDVA